MDDTEPHNEPQAENPAPPPAKPEVKPEPTKCKSCASPAQPGSMFCSDHQMLLVPKHKKRFVARLDVMLVACLIAALVGYPRMKGKATRALADYMESESSNEPGFFAKANDFLVGLIGDEEKKPDEDTKRVAAALRKALLGGGGAPSPVVEEMLQKVEQSGQPLTLDEAIDQLQAMSGSEHMGLSSSQLAQLQSMRSHGGSAATAGAPAASNGPVAAGGPIVAPAPYCVPPPDRHNSPALAALSKCGNGIIETGEECDGPALGGASCKSLGFTGECGQESGCIQPQLACLPSCSFDYSGCTTEDEAALQRFVHNSDGTASDRLTGLMWEQKCTELTCGDQHNVLATVSWRSSGTDWVTALNRDRYAGHDDWRLPSLEELRTLLTVVPPCPSEPCAGSAWPRAQTAAAGYWTSTTFAIDKNRAWAVSFADGDVYTAEKSETLHVRAVRRVF